LSVAKRDRKVVGRTIDVRLSLAQQARGGVPLTMTNEEPDRGRVWRRSSYCEGGACVEVAVDRDDVMIRNSEDPDGARLVVARSRWSALLADLKKSAA
jgi:hypothetical protein